MGAIKTVYLTCQVKEKIVYIRAVKKNAKTLDLTKISYYFWVYPFT